MNTILYKEIDGHEILIGFGKPVADPEATKGAVKKLLEKTDEYKAMVAIGEEISAINRTFRDESRRVNEETNAKVRSGELKTPAQAAEYARAQIQPAISARDTALAANQDRALAASLALEEKRKELARANPVYCELPAHEKMATDEEVTALRVSMHDAPEGAKVDTAGAIIEDHRNGLYWHKGPKGWYRESIERLGDKPKGKKLDDLTDVERVEIREQLNAERIAGLSPRDKAAEKVRAIEVAADQAAHMRSKLEIQGTAAEDALTQSREWYEGEVARLEALYT